MCPYWQFGSTARRSLRVVGTAERALARALIVSIEKKRILVMGECVFGCSRAEYQRLAFREFNESVRRLAWHKVCMSCGKPTIEAKTQLPRKQEHPLLVEVEDQAGSWRFIYCFSKSPRHLRKSPLKPLV